MAIPDQSTPATPYRGRFAPSPTGALHAGSMVAALASWLDARAHDGTWLVRIEDTDTPRNRSGAAEQIVRQLAACGMVSDEPVWHQSQRTSAYTHALQSLGESARAYRCTCSRSAIEATWRERGRHEVLKPGIERPYPGTCRPGLAAAAASRRSAWRLALPQAAVVHWHDRRLGAHAQDVGAAVGDFVLKRSDGLWAYQLAVVVDDAAQGITHVVRGEDLADNTPRQILLQRALGVPTPHYLHTPLVLAADGQKLSKQTGARAIEVDTPAQALAALQSAAQVLGLPPAVPATSDAGRRRALSIAQALAQWVQAWRTVWRQPVMQPAAHAVARVSGVQGAGAQPHLSWPYPQRRSVG
jgi:glutamyl-Q tRNA(Asp) synthetase